MTVERGGLASRVSGERTRRKIPEATVARLPVYFRVLLASVEHKTTTISSDRLAELAGVNAAKVRKDLSYLGSYGTRGVGYDVEFLLYQISQELGLTNDWAVAIVGIGNLGQALANYGGFSARGFRIAALLDSDPAKVGTMVADRPIEHLDELDRIVHERAVAIAVLAVPAPASQSVADRLVRAGVTSILNFAPTVLSVPAEVLVRDVDLAIELQILSFYHRRRLDSFAVGTSVSVGTSVAVGDTLAVGDTVSVGTTVEAVG